MKIKENELFDPVKIWLENNGYEVYSEVSPRGIGQRADIVGKHGKVILIVELKTTLSLELIDQAYFWKKYAHYVYVAIPKRTKKIPDIIKEYLYKEGIGILEISPIYFPVLVRQKAKFNRPPLLNKIDWEKELLPEHKTWLKGGSSGGGYVTPFKITVQNIKKYLYHERFKWFSQRTGDSGWRSINDILEHCETHYANPKSTVSAILRNNNFDWCEVKKENGRLWFRYVGSANDHI
jgi:hypothetical protein